ncbi:uncharacterized protein LOC144508211 [Mustelus asterias]
MASLLWLLLILQAISPGSAKGETYVISTDSATVLLPCSSQDWHAKLVNWHWANETSRKGHTVVTVEDSQARCKSNAHPHITFAKADCFGARDFSLSFTPTLQDGGVYTCGVQLLEGTLHITRFYLIVFRALVTPAIPVAVGGTVSFAVELSVPFNVSRMVWDPDTAQGTLNRLGFQWKHNGAPIEWEGRHALHAGTFNISCFQEKDAGEYTLTGRLKNGMTASDSRRVELAESSSHTPLIVGVILAVIGVTCLITTAIVIYRRPRLSQHRQRAGSYVNVAPQVHHSNQNSPESQSDYMSLNLDRQSLYSQLHK